MAEPSCREKLHLEKWPTYLFEDDGYKNSSGMLYGQCVDVILEIIRLTETFDRVDNTGS